jgi:hypothetical protein
LWKKDRSFSGLRCKESIDDFTLLLKSSRLVIEVRPFLRHTAKRDAPRQPAPRRDSRRAKFPTRAHASEKPLLVQHKQILESRWLRLLVWRLQYLQIGPGLAAKSCRVFTPKLRRAIFVGNIGILQPLCLNDIVNSVAGHHDEIRLIVSQVADAIGVLDRESELFWKLREALDIGYLL